MRILEKLKDIDEADVAIIGMTGRFPKAQNIDKFWQSLRDGVELISFFSDQELASAGIDPAVLSDPNYVKAAASLEHIDLFDSSFFGYSPRDAEIMDPQHRIFLESAWEALESAGYDPETYSGSIGVYAGSSMSSYLFNIYSNTDVKESVSNVEISLGNYSDYLPTRVSFKLNLKGPSYAIQTSCSTSLVAIHVACQSLLSDECDMALAGGISILNMQPKTGYRYQEDGILSPDGHCRAFDVRAQGTLPGSGVGIVVLKRLKNALADGDCIHAVIKGSATNNDGSLKAGFTAPSVEGQTAVIEEAIAAAGVEAETITYVEAHGTGTPLGDPIEIKALTKAFRSSTKKLGFCAIGSVKTNIGHLDATAGVAGLIKTVLALKHKQIPPSLNFEQPNPKIDFANSPFYVNSKLSEWRAESSPRRAGVTSLGFGGTNAHMILEEAPLIQASGPGRAHKLLMLSAKTSTALETATANLANHLKQHPELNLADVAYTLQVGRQTFNHRRILVCHDLDDAVKGLHSLEPQRVFTHYQQPCNRPVVFMFSGQGAQYVNMARELYQSEPKFAEQVDYCAELLNLQLGLDLRTVLYPSEEQVQEAVQQLSQTVITQPALFVIEYALSKLWMTWGVRPEAMIGHSIGEYVAATLSGVLSLEDALALVAIRGRLMQQLPKGAMLSVQLSEQNLQLLLGNELSLAGINGPSLCVVSGSVEAVDKLQQKLLEKHVGCRRLHTSHAFHSQMMNPILKPFTESLRKVKLNPPKIPFLSNVSGTWITAAEATNPNYWVRHLQQPVRFSEGIAELLKQPERVLLEVGPGRTLSTFALQHQTNQLVALTSIRHPQEPQSDTAFLLNTLGRLWLLGVQVNWSNFYSNEQRYRLPLPTYPFERQRYWISPQRQADDIRPTKDEKGAFQSCTNSLEKGQGEQGGQEKCICKNGMLPDENPSSPVSCSPFPVPHFQVKSERSLKLESLQDIKQNSEQSAPARLSKTLHPRPKLWNDYVAPDIPIEQTLAQIWQQVLSIEQVGIYDDFFELGGHSLLAVHLMAKIKKQLGQNLQVSTLFQGATIKHQANLLRQPANDQSSSPLVAIQPHGSKPPLFFVHPIGGNVFCYHELSSHLGSDQPFFGLQALGLDGKCEPYTRIEDMATCYIKALQVIQPKGPYLLGGWSMGGVVAFEMAQQIQKQGHKVALLAMLDTPAPVSPDLPTNIDDFDDFKILVNFALDMAHSTGKNLSGSVDQLKKLGLDEQLNYFLEQARRVDLVPPDFELQQLRCLLKVFKSNLQALKSYVPQVYPNQIIYFQASDEVSDDFSNLATTWEKLSLKPIKTVPIAGNHYTLMAKPQIQIVSEYLKSYLNQV